MFLKKIIALILGVFLLTANVSGKEYAKSVMVNCGKIKIQLNKHTYWNINRLWYEGYSIGEASGYWGTVFALHGLGFVGSGHLTK